jgi:hypothetical protein
MPLVPAVPANSQASGHTGSQSPTVPYTAGREISKHVTTWVQFSGSSRHSGSHFKVQQRQQTRGGSDATRPVNSNGAEGVEGSAASRTDAAADRDRGSRCQWRVGPRTSRTHTPRKALQR